MGSKGNGIASEFISILSGRKNKERGSEMGYPINSEMEVKRRGGWKTEGLGEKSGGNP